MSRDEIYCGNNLYEVGAKRIGTPYECLKKGIGQGLHSNLTGFNPNYQAIIADNSYCGTGSLPRGKQMGSPTSCLRKGVGIGKRLQYDRIDGRGGRDRIDGNAGRNRDAGRNRPDRDDGRDRDAGRNREDGWRQYEMSEDEDEPRPRRRRPRSRGDYDTGEYIRNIGTKYTGDPRRREEEVLLAPRYPRRLPSPPPSSSQPNPSQCPPPRRPRIIVSCWNWDEWKVFLQKWWPIILALLVGVVAAIFKATYVNILLSMILVLIIGWFIQSMTC